MLSLSHVSLNKGKNVILDDVTLEVAPGECICIVGPAGTGKTSILELLLGLQKPSKGAVSIDEMDLATLPSKFLKVYRQSVGYMPQEDLLIPHENVAVNVALPLRLRRTDRSEIEKCITKLLLQTGLLEKAASYPQTLTQSERKRVALARALIGKPGILLLDDPLAHCDALSTQMILTLIKEKHRTGVTIIFTVESQTLTGGLGARVLSLARGTIIERTPTAPSSPALRSPMTRATRIIPFSV